MTLWCTAWIKQLKFSSVQYDNNTRELTKRFWKLKAFYDAQIPIIIQMNRTQVYKTWKLTNIFVQMVSMSSEMPICAPPHLSEVSPTLPLKWFPCLSDWRWQISQRNPPNTPSPRELYKLSSLALSICSVQSKQTRGPKNTSTTNLEGYWNLSQTTTKQTNESTKSNRHNSGGVSKSLSYKANKQKLQKQTIATNLEGTEISVLPPVVQNCAGSIHEPQGSAVSWPAPVVPGAESSPRVL